MIKVSDIYGEKVETVFDFPAKKLKRRLKDIHLLPEGVKKLTGICSKYENIAKTMMKFWNSQKRHKLTGKYVFPSYTHINQNILIFINTFLFNGG